MKVAILTITDGTNYGNRLQNYALQEVLKELGIEVETIRRKTFHDLSIKVKIINNIKHLIKTLIRSNNTYWGNRNRINKFNDFNQKYIKFNKTVLHDNISPKGFSSQFDYFVCGSDQIWNTNFRIVREDLLNHLAAFAKPCQRIAYAASFGTNSIPKLYVDAFQDNIPLFKAIGVRESSGIDIIQNLCDRNDVQVVLDPTLLLSCDKWSKIAKKPQYMNTQKYILTYFLGGRTESVLERINELSKRTGFISINLDKEGLSDSKIENKNVYATAPDEFLWLIKNAELVLTDSFHACVFSILFHKSFIPYKRKTMEKDNKMEGRLQTLFHKLGVNPVIDNVDDSHEMPMNYDVGVVENKLEKEREKSIFFLKTALGI